MSAVKAWIYAAFSKCNILNANANISRKPQDLFSLAWFVVSPSNRDPTKFIGLMKNLLFILPLDKHHTDWRCTDESLLKNKTISPSKKSKKSKILFSWEGSSYCTFKTWSPQRAEGQEKHHHHKHEVINTQYFCLLSVNPSYVVWRIGVLVFRLLGVFRAEQRFFCPRGWARKKGQ